MNSLKITAAFRLLYQEPPMPLDPIELSIDFVDRCLREDVCLFGLPRVLYKTMGPQQDIHVICVVWGIAEYPCRELPPLDEIGRAVYAYFALHLADAAVQIISIDVAFRYIQGLHEVFVIESDAEGDESEL